MAFKFILKNTQTKKSKSFEFSGDGEYFVGRGENCDIRVGDKKTSSKHFKIIIKNLEVSVVDLESHNGIAIDGYQILSSRFYVGAKLEFGVYELRIDKKALSPKELVCNTRGHGNKDGGANDITMIATAKGLLIQRDAIADFSNNTEEKNVRFRAHKDVPLNGKKPDNKKAPVKKKKIIKKD